MSSDFAQALTENEITAARRVLQVLDWRGKIVTGDALLAQRDLAALIVEGGGDYVWTVKDNQPQVFKLERHLTSQPAVIYSEL